jgi:hypothetical protein
MQQGWDEMDFKKRKANGERRNGQKGDISANGERRTAKVGKNFCVKKMKIIKFNLCFTL